MRAMLAMVVAVAGCGTASARSGSETYECSREYLENAVDIPSDAVPVTMVCSTASDDSTLCYQASQWEMRDGTVYVDCNPGQTFTVGWVK